MRDLIDHHRRVSVKTNNIMKLTVPYRPPVTTISRDSFIGRFGTPEIAEISNPEAKTRPGDVAPPSHRLKVAQRERRRSRPIGGYQKSPYLFIPYNGRALKVGKKEFITTATDHGMRQCDIRDFIMHFMVPKPAETPQQFKRRVTQQVYITVSNHKRGKAVATRVPRYS